MLGCVCVSLLEYGVLHLTGQPIKSPLGSTDYLDGYQSILSMTASTTVDQKETLNGQGE